MSEQDQDDILTAGDTEKILRNLIDAAGIEGIERDELERQFEIAAKEIRHIKFDAALYEAFAAQEVKIAVVNDEMVYRSAEPKAGQ